MDSGARARMINGQMLVARFEPEPEMKTLLMPLEISAGREAALETVIDVAEMEPPTADRVNRWSILPAFPEALIGQDAAR
ncbi:MAG: hypothetical protein Kow0026_20660 [Oricola sp.]